MPSNDDIENYWERKVPLDSPTPEGEELPQEGFRAPDPNVQQGAMILLSSQTRRQPVYPEVPPDIHRRAMALLGFPAPLMLPQMEELSPGIQQRAVERAQEELSHEDAMILFPPPEDPQGSGQSVISLATPQIASFLGLENPAVQSGTSGSATLDLRIGRPTDEDLRDLYRRELARILNMLGIAASVREYTNNGVRSLFITFRGEPVIGSRPYNLSVSPTSEEGLVLQVQFE
jgi:hypothetical protein